MSDTMAKNLPLGPAPMAGFTQADVDRVARHMARRIVTEINLPPQFRRLGYVRSILVACREGLRALVRQLQGGGGLRTADMQRLASMGAQQAEMGVPLEVILSAYRLAAKVVWQELISQTEGLEQLAPQTIINITGQVLEYLDEISGAVGAAYLDTRERLMRQRDRDRDRVLQRLLAGDVGPDLRRLAATTDLPLQPPYLVVACATDTPAAETTLDVQWRSHGALLVADRPGIWLALLPGKTDAAGLARMSGGTLTSGLICGIGPLAQSLEEVAGAAQRARETLEIGRRLYPQRQFWHENEVAPYIALAEHPERISRFMTSTLGTLADNSKARNRELIETLEVLLEADNVSDAAARLGVHRHTVVYRMQRLRSLRIDIDSADARHQLWLALRARKLLAADGI